MVLDGKETRLGPGCCFILTPGSRPKATHNPKTPLVVCAMHVDFLNEEQEPITEFGELPTNTPVWVPEVRRLQLLANFMVGTSQDGVDAQLALWQLLHLIQFPTSGAGARIDERIQRVQRRIAERLAHPWDTAEMATIAHLSSSRFTALFREQLGTSPKQYLIAARMNRAASLLMETRLSQTELAENLGFQDVYFFNRQFTRFHGVPPGRYKKQATE